MLLLLWLSHSVSSIFAPNFLLDPFLVTWRRNVPFSQGARSFPRRTLALHSTYWRPAYDVLLSFEQMNHRPRCFITKAFSATLGITQRGFFLNSRSRQRVVGTTQPSKIKRFPGLLVDCFSERSTFLNHNEIVAESMIHQLIACEKA